VEIRKIRERMKRNERKGKAERQERKRRTKWEDTSARGRKEKKLEKKQGEE
jgi:hypothetical protein